MSKTARRVGCGSRGGRLVALPEDVLDAVLAFGNLRARFACVAATRQLRDGHARLSPDHERTLVLLHYPLLAVALQGSPTTLAPRELFLSQQQAFHVPNANRQTIAAPKWREGAYTFALELLMTKPTASQVPIDESTIHFTLYAGTASLENGSSTLEFEIPEGVWERAQPLIVSETQWVSCRAQLMVIRRDGGIIERARLYNGDLSFEQDEDDLFTFDLTAWLPEYGSAIDWQEDVQRTYDLVCEPDLALSWHAHSIDDANDGASTLVATFRWHLPGATDFDDMDTENILQLLQHYVVWSRL